MTMMMTADVIEKKWRVVTINDATPCASQRTFINDATRIWNKAPVTIRNSVTAFSAKKAIKEFIVTLPI